MAKVHLTVTVFSGKAERLPFEEGQIIYLKKDSGNAYDSEAIIAHLPYIGPVGFVAGSPDTVIRGTMSAGRVYDRFGQNAVVKVEFITGKSLICRLLPDKKIKKYLNMFESFEAELMAYDRKISAEGGLAAGGRLPGVPGPEPIPITPLWEK